FLSFGFTSPTVAVRSASAFATVPGSWILHRITKGPHNLISCDRPTRSTSSMMSCLHASRRPARRFRPAPEFTPLTQTPRNLGKLKLHRIPHTTNLPRDFLLQ